MSKKFPLRCRLFGRDSFGEKQTRAHRRRILRTERLEDRQMFSVATATSEWNVDEPINDVTSAQHALQTDGYFVNDFGNKVIFDPAPDPTKLTQEASTEETGGGSASKAPYPLSQTFLLHSNPSATKVIYLDFNGHTTSGTQWNDDFNFGFDFATPAYSFEGDSSFSNAELERIQKIWERVAEDYIPFNVDVTTEYPGVAALRKLGAGDQEWGNHVVIGGSSYQWYNSDIEDGVGGVAYVGSFTWNSDTPSFVFPQQLSNGNEKSIAEAISHEVGHTLGLEHDGTSTDGYYWGHGSGATGWAPIMGSGV